MARWQRTKDLDENADMLVECRTAQLIYKSVISYLNRCHEPWQDVVARLNFLKPEAIYNEITIDGVLNYADQELINDCQSIAIRHSVQTFTDNAIAVIEIDINRAEPLGSFGHMIDYLT